MKESIILFSENLKKLYIFPSIHVFLFLSKMNENQEVIFQLNKLFGILSQQP